VAGLLGSLPISTSLPGRLGLLGPVAASLAGFLALDLWLWRRTSARAARMATELPDVLDLLRVAMQAGLPSGRALAEVGRRHRGALACEFGRAAGRLALGASRDDALEDLQRRVPLPEAAALVAILQRAERLGAPPAEPLAALAEEARSSRARAAAEAAARAAPQIQLVVALLLVPAVMLLVAAALVPALT
jgi:tight adherence protein C